MSGELEARSLAPYSLVHTLRKIQSIYFLLGTCHSHVSSALVQVITAGSLQTYTRVDDFFVFSIYSHQRPRQYINKFMVIRRLRRPRNQIQIILKRGHIDTKSNYSITYTLENLLRKQTIEISGKCPIAIRVRYSGVYRTPQM